MATTILGGSGTYQQGVEVVEAFGNCEAFSVRYFPFLDNKVSGIGGEPFLRVRSTVPSRDISGSGEFSGSLTQFSWSTVSTVANDVADTGSAAGSIFLAELTMGQNRANLRGVDFKLDSNPTITAT